MMEAITKYFSEFTEEQQRQWQLLGPLYKDWNEKINVISRKDIDLLYERHILHSLSIAAVFDFDPGIQIIDLGTGGGFPGLPLAIFFPEVEFLLVDSIGKKLKVIDAIAEELGIKNVKTRHTRIEDIKDKKADFVVSRAVAPLADLWRWTKPLLKKTTTNSKEPARVPGLICLKGGDLAKEIQESQTRPSVVDIHTIFDDPFFEEKYILYVRK